MAFPITSNVQVKRDRSGFVRRLSHPAQPYTEEQFSMDAAVAGPVTARSLADQYVREVLPAFELAPTMAADLAAAIGGDVVSEGPRLKFHSEKRLGDHVTVSYAQTCLGVPVWEAGFTVQIHGQPNRVVGSQCSASYDLAVEPPPANAPFGAERISVPVLTSLLGLGPSDPPPRINGTRLWVYRYDPTDRGNAAGPPGKDDPEQMHVAWPALDLPPAPRSVVPGRDYVVTDVLFTLSRPGWDELNWSALIEPQSGAVLKLRAFVGCINGQVYLRDPLTKTGNTAITPASSASVLNPLRDLVTLDGLNPPSGGQQELRGEFVRLIDITTPNTPPPTQPAGVDFNYSVPTDNFSAVNAYYHCDRLFRMVRDMGFDTTQYFDGTTFPVRVDHRVSFNGTPNIVNASAPGNAQGNGSDGFRFALVQTNTNVGIAVEWRVVLHEFGHTILWDHVDSPNFRFSHSAGDSLAAILNDVESSAPDRGRTFPWTIITRRHDFSPSSGFAWGGTQDDPFPVGHPSSTDQAGYRREQILSSTLFRLYRAIGGAHTDVNVRRSAANYAVFLIYSGIGTLTPFAQPQDAADFADVLMDADRGTTTFHGEAGGYAHKVVRWAFEQQGAYQPAGAPTPVSSPGAPPAVDVYINDGRNGAYTPGPQFAASSLEIWNRRNADSGQTHENPVAGQPNFIYARVRNRGTSAAPNVVARAFHSGPAAARLWPADWIALTPAPVSVAASIAAGGNAIAGPFEWTPSAAGNNAVLVSASAAGDPSNVDTVQNAIATEKLLHCDNNAALREIAVAPVAPANAILSAASFTPGAVSPGEILSIFGAALGPAQPLIFTVDAAGNIARQLGPTRVLFDGSAAALLFVSQSQVNVIAPFALAGRASVNVEVEVSGVRSAPVTLPVVNARPGIFSLSQGGTGQGAVLNQDNTVNGPAAPAPLGTIIQIFATGGGVTSPPSTDGRIVPNAQHLLTAPVRVEIGGINATIHYAGGAPGLVFGAIQVNAAVPAGVTPGAAVSLQLFVGGAASLTGITIAVS